ncbi:MAG: pyridoxal-phosphate dependent enzyme, partial [Bacteroidota bacterium]
LGSIFKHYKETGEIIKGTPYLVEGIGQDCLPENVHFQYIDKIINISDKESFAAARRLTKEEGIFCGGSTGTIVHVALEVAKDLTENDLIVFIVCDTGERYLSKMHNEGWLKMNRMLDAEIKILRDVSDAKKKKGIEEIIYVHDSILVRDVIKLMNTKGFSQIPVLNEFMKPVGSIREGKLMGKLLEDPKLLNAPVNSVMEDVFPVVDAKTPVSDVKNILKDSSAILVSDFGRITDLLTRYDLIDIE